MGKIPLTMMVNGREESLMVAPNARLLDVLRELGLTGVKEGCGEGECGACTVLLNGKAVDSCLLFALQAQGSEVVTIEGLSMDGALHPIQQAFIEAGAVQCGFCTPGFIMSTYALLQAHPCPTREEIIAFLEGNLCRCTGYHGIVEAVDLAAKRMAHEEGKSCPPAR